MNFRLITAQNFQLKAFATKGWDWHSFNCLRLPSCRNNEVHKRKKQWVGFQSPFGMRKEVISEIETNDTSYPNGRSKVKKPKDKGHVKNLKEDSYAKKSAGAFTWVDPKGHQLIFVRPQK